MVNPRCWAEAEGFTSVLNMLIEKLTFALLSLNAFVLVFVSSASRNRSTVILLGLDGFRWDFMSKANTPNMDSIVKTGVKAPFVKSVFPTVTMPNLYTIVTGLYPESHGIIANEMFDPVFRATFDSSNNESRWWNGGEPVWVTNQKQGHKSGTCFWPGYDVVIRGYFPSFSSNGTRYNKPFVYPYANAMPAKERIDMTIEWLTGEDPPTFVALYFLDTDTAGHRYAPDSPEVKATIRNFDANVTGYLIKQLRQADLLDEVNIIVTSDHGMLAYNTSNFVNFDDFVNASTYRAWSGNKAFFTIQPLPGNETYVYESLKKEQNRTQLFEVYKREDVPDSLHFKHNRRIGSIVGLMKKGWYIRSSNLPEPRQPDGVIRGDHGYSNAIEDMNPFFIARGPAFKENLISEPFELTDIYPLICKILGIEPAPHNGSLSRVKQLLRERLPNSTTTDSTPGGSAETPTEKERGTGNKIVKIAGFTVLGFAAGVCVVASILLTIRWCNRRNRPRKVLVENDETQGLQAEEVA